MKLSINCTSCGVEIDQSTRNTVRNKNNYCNRECYDNRRKKNLKRLKRTTKYYKELINNSVCECGESKNYLLQIHHIDGNHKNHNSENLEIVCANCHIKRHLQLNKFDEFVHNPKSLTDRKILKNL